MHAGCYLYDTFLHQVLLRFAFRYCVSFRLLTKKWTAADDRPGNANIKRTCQKLDNSKAADIFPQQKERKQTL